jgi:hypothetical protein
MKFLIGFMFLVYIIVYIYSCHMTKVEPQRNIWGYICTIVFAILFIWGISIIIKNQKKNEENNE